MDYKEKLEKAKELYPTANADQRYVLESLFPELRESDDERIKKEILELISISGNGNQFEEIKDWLEKQGEQKPQRMVSAEAKEAMYNKPAWSEEDETIKNNISHIIRQYDKISKRENKPCWYIGDCLLWMQNIKDRVQPQPKKE